MPLTKPALPFVLTLITVVIASRVDDSASSSHASFSQSQGPSNTLNVNNRNEAPRNNVQNDPAPDFAVPLSRHIFSKTSGIMAKTQTKPPRYSNRPTEKARSFGGVTTRATSSGTSVTVSNNSGKRCVTVKLPCGTTCSPNSKSIGMCAGPWKPKYCSKTKRLIVTCPGKKIKWCKTTEKVRRMCEKKVQKKVRCPDTVEKRTVCAYPRIAVHSCKKHPARCAKMEKRKCQFKTVHEKFPCRRPTRPCRECYNKTAFKKCHGTVTRRVEVPCGGSATLGAAATAATPRPSPTPTGIGSGSNSTTASPLPSSSSVPSTSPSDTVEFFDEEGGYDPSSDGGLGSDAFENGLANEDEDGDFGDSSAIPVTFGSAPEHTKSVKCFASLFNDDDCELAPPFCQLFNNAFDSEKCTREVCRECEVIKKMPVGKELREYCRDLRASCHFFSRMLVTRVMETAAIARSAVEKSEESNKCYRNETKTVVVPCNYPLPKSEVCLRGCRIGKCEKIQKKRVSKYCRGHLHKDCYRNCKRKLVKRKVCHTFVDRKRSKKVCKKDTKVRYKCHKKKTVKKPCKGQASKLCTQLKKVWHVCGKEGGKIGKCTGAKGEKRCTKKLCVQKKCS